MIDKVHNARGWGLVTLTRQRNIRNFTDRNLRVFCYATVV
jgi:hypothetical protein